MHQKLNVKALALIILIASALPVHASYTVSCAEDLRQGWSPRMVERWEEQGASLSRNFGMSRPLSYIEYEATLDSSHGLDLEAQFEDGVEARFTDSMPSLIALSERLKVSRIEGVRYTPEALAKLGAIFREACDTLARPGCSAYDDFRGFNDKRPRPFSAPEEQALKWATIHSFPQLSTLDTYREYGFSLERLDVAMKSIEAHRQKKALYMLPEIFSSRDAAILYQEFVQPEIAKQYRHFLETFRTLKQKSLN